ncbi:hypothetical protein LF1_41960 [Rubripirellula obstinata]|uniref:Protein-glutamine gamma-glutamyltransferase-like C-terminal domain-containing protein n=1 Tax=Rubripirellula obstinata TaxID=406547 RepID=A0A5B1CMW4_9BACT|nr:DUF4129 domain-containing protein [Rubripirellula obstinata]KAA1261641.1 hypothetical protein LF1_41960 [Rubripirellula obstinata]
MTEPTTGKRRPTAGDYAVIAVAPILVFVMISSLANFLMLVIYRGGQPARVSWIVLMFTMGVVGIARIAIEKDRMYSLGYGSVLGIASFATLSRYVNSPLSTLFLLALIAYLADWVIRDCTLIDEDADSSDRGLLDSLKRNSGQPGRSVLYLALAAFPLYGLGQFMIRGDAGTWSKAQWLLACYLFSALALLVTTSFLGLRRYLRQRGADMPADVSVGWLGGGAAIIAILLCVAFLVPVPGEALASLELPKFLDSRDDTTASNKGWGKDGAEKAGEDAATTGSDANLADKDKEVGSAAPQKGAPAGDVGDGDRKDGPAGKKEGGKKDSSGDKKGAKQKSEKSDDQQKTDSKSDSQKNNDSPPSESEDSKQQPGETKPSDSDSKETDPNSEKKSDQAEQDQSKTESQAKNESSGQSNSRSNPASSPMQKAADIVPAIAALLKWLVLAVLLGIVGFYIYINRQFLIEFWQNLFAREETPSEPTLDEFVQEVQTAPRRAFGSITQPSSNQTDPRKIVVATFAALDAWSHEAGVSRSKGETPTEFLARVRQNHRSLSTPASRVIAAYNRIVYGRGNASHEDVQACDQLWDLMKSSPQ